jgi:hypothetical protein
MECAVTNCIDVESGNGGKAWCWINGGCTWP